MQEKGSWVTIYQAQETYDALEIKNLLQEQGIPCRLQGSGSVQVPPQMAASARELVDTRPDKAEL